MKGKDGKIKYLKDYFENLSPNDFKVEIDGKSIKITPNDNG